MSDRLYAQSKTPHAYYRAVRDPVVIETAKAALKGNPHANENDWQWAEGKILVRMSAQ